MNENPLNDFDNHIETESQEHHTPQRSTNDGEQNVPDPKKRALLRGIEKFFETSIKSMTPAASIAASEVTVNKVVEENMELPNEIVITRKLEQINPEIKIHTSIESHSFPDNLNSTSAVMGEVYGGYSQIKSLEDIAFVQEGEETILGGSELLTQETALLLVENLKKPRLIFTTDTYRTPALTPEVTLEYFAQDDELQNGLFNKEKMSAYVVGASALFYTIYKSEDYSRRDFLKIAGGTIAYSAIRPFVRNFFYEQNWADFDEGNIRSLWQEFFTDELTPHSLVVDLRDRIMAQNSLAIVGNLDLGNEVNDMFFYAGSGHKGISKIIDDDPQKIQDDTSAFIERVLTRADEIYSRPDIDSVDKDQMFVFAALLSEQFCPTMMRKNLTEEESTALFNDESALISDHHLTLRENKSGPESVAVTFIKTMKKLIDEKNNQGKDSGLYKNVMRYYYDFFSQKQVVTSSESNFVSMYPLSPDNPSDDVLEFGSFSIIINNGFVAQIKSIRN